MSKTLIILASYYIGCPDSAHERDRLALLESLVILALGFGPPMVILNIIIRAYEEHLVWERIFTYTLIGIIGGIFIAVLHLTLEVMAGYDVASLLLIEGLLAFIEQGIIMVVFNLPRFQRKWDTPFYAASFGSGVASMLFLIRVYPLATGMEGAIFTFDLFAQSLFWSLTLAFLFPSVASIVGFGASKGQAMRYYPVAAVMQWSGFTILSFAIAQDPSHPDVGLVLGASAGAFAFAFFVFLIVMGYIYPQCAPEEKKGSKKKSKE